MRWRLLLPDGAAPTGALFKSLIVGFSVNDLLPARLGEVARAYLIKRSNNVPYAVAFASLVVERILDGLSLVVWLVAALVVVPSAPGYLYFLGFVAGLAFCACAGFVALVAYRPHRLELFAHRLADRLPSGAVSRLGELMRGVDQAIRQLRVGRRLAKLVALSLVGWASELGLFYAVMLGFRFPASAADAFVTGAAANFATLVPSSPGYVGTFDGVIVKVLTDSIGVTTDLAVAYAVVVHATLFVPVVALGSIILWRANLSLGSVARRAPAAAEAQVLSTAPRIDQSL
jgi:glycosyltransferase 2 family protein